MLNYYLISFYSWNHGLEVASAATTQHRAVGVCERSGSDIASVNSALWNSLNGLEFRLPQDSRRTHPNVWLRKWNLPWIISCSNIIMYALSKTIFQLYCRTNCANWNVDEAATTTLALTIWLKLATITICLVGGGFANENGCEAMVEARARHVSEKAFPAKNAVWELLCQHRDVETHLHFPEIGLNETEAMISTRCWRAFAAGVMVNENKKISINPFISMAHRWHFACGGAVGGRFDSKTFVWHAESSKTLSREWSFLMRKALNAESTDNRAYFICRFSPNFPFRDCCRCYHRRCRHRRCFLSPARTQQLFYLNSSLVFRATRACEPTGGMAHRFRRKWQRKMVCTNAAKRDAKFSIESRSGEEWCAAKNAGDERWKCLCTLCVVIIITTLPFSTFSRATSICICGKWCFG